jgi:uncharacterized membrane protein YphA (DoxX/SURF4 family)
MKQIATLLKHSFFTLLLRLVLGFMFLYSGASKLDNPAQFAEAISNYQILPQAFINACAIVVPWLEIASGFAVLTGILLRGGAFLLALLLLVFTCAVGLSVLNGIDISCGCSTPISFAARVGFGKLLENFALLAAALCVFKFGKPAFSLSA